MIKRLAQNMVVTWVGLLGLWLIHVLFLRSGNSGYNHWLYILVMLFANSLLPLYLFFCGLNYGLVKMGRKGYGGLGWQLLAGVDGYVGGTAGDDGV